MDAVKRAVAAALRSLPGAGRRRPVRPARPASPALQVLQVLQVLLAAAATLMAPPARAADALPDPMRPSGAATAGHAVPSPGTGPAPARNGGAAAGGWKLQSVLLGAAGAQAAVISGRLVTVGDRLGEARLLRLTERSAVLAGPQGQTTLLLIPGVDKQDSRTGPLQPLAVHAAPAQPAARPTWPPVPEPAP